MSNFDLRPKSLDKDFIGQTKLLNKLRRRADAAKRRKQSLGHVFLTGGPGLGKTSIAKIIASYMNNAPFREVAASGVRNATAMTNFLHEIAGAPKGIVVFIDEIHRCRLDALEVLYTALEDRSITVTDKDAEGDTTTFIVQLPEWTCIVATTDESKVSEPFRDRFPIKGHMEWYKNTELARIITRAAEIYGLGIDPDAAMYIAKRGRQTPRVALNLLQSVRDTAEDANAEVISLSHAIAAMTEEGIDEIGLTEFDRRILYIIAVDCFGRTIGEQSLRRRAGKDPGATLAYLDRIGFTDGQGVKGRAATPLALRYVAEQEGIKLPVMVRARSGKTAATDEVSIDLDKFLRELGE